MSKTVTITPDEVTIITASQVGSSYEVQVAYDCMQYLFTIPRSAVVGTIAPNNLKLPIIPLLLARYNKV